MPVASNGPIATAKKQPPSEQILRLEMAEILEHHQLWVESQGSEGTKADLSNANLEGADLCGTNLQGADLSGANLRGADLLLADLRGACLIQADLHEANLLGTQLQDAELQGALLATSTGLSVTQLAGANLSGTTLSNQILELLELDEASRLSRKAQKIFAVVGLLTLLASWVIFATKDVQLLKNSPIFPVPHIGDAIPTVHFYLVAPLFLLGIYTYFHLFLQRLWDGLAGLPAVFPDGRRLDQCGPRTVLALTRVHFKRLGRYLSPPSILEASLSLIFAYWLVPATIVLFWARYLTSEDLRGTMLQIFLAVCAVGVATFLPNMVGRTLRTDHPQPFSSGSARPVYRWWILIATGAVLTCLSVGTIRGIPHDSSRARDFGAANIRRWAANIFWLAGYSPYADLTESVVSTKPANWSGRDEDLSQIRGAALNNLNLRYIEAYRAFLVNAHLWQADLTGADLSEADLRGANLRKANLQSAVLDRAELNHAKLGNANLDSDNLTRADLRWADLSYSSLLGATLAEAKLDDANLYAAVLTKAVLVRASLERADLRDAKLEGANLAFADLKGADLWSTELPAARLRGAQLDHAILFGADLQGADLQEADLQQSILREADLRGANLRGADFRGAMGLSTEQICSAAVKTDIRLDEGLQHQVNTICGPIQ